MKVFIDTDVIYDVLTHRPEHYDNSALVLDIVFSEQIEAFTSPVIIANLYFLLSKRPEGKAAAVKQVISLLEDIHVEATDHNTIMNAFSSSFTDKEDAIQYFTAVKGRAKYLITRNVKDYATAEDVAVISPSDFLNLRSVKKLLENR